jgi:hypothetical protein
LAGRPLFSFQLRDAGRHAVGDPVQHFVFEPSDALARQFDAARERSLAFQAPDRDAAQASEREHFMFEKDFEIGRRPASTEGRGVTVGVACRIGGRHGGAAAGIGTALFFELWSEKR